MSKNQLFFEQMKLVCDDKSISVDSVVPACTMSYKSQLYMCHCKVKGCTCYIPPPHTSADKTSTHSRSACALRAPPSPDCFSHLCSKTSSLHNPDVRLPEGLRFMLDRHNLPRRRVILTLCIMYKENTATMTITQFTFKNVHSGELPWKSPLLQRASSASTIVTMPRLSPKRTGIDANNVLLVVALKNFVPCQLCSCSCRSRWPEQALSCVLLRPQVSRIHVIDSLRSRSLRGADDESE